MKQSTKAIYTSFQRRDAYDALKGISLWENIILMK